MNNENEVLECLEHIKKYYIPEPCSAKTYDCLETIKQALLKAQENARSEEILQKYYQEGITLDSVRALKKEMAELKKQAQEPKKYLTWEDLDFKEENFPIKVKVGNTEYLLCFHNIGKDQALTIQNYDQLLCTFYLNSYYDKQFFNDLKLERVE